MNELKLNKAYVLRMLKVSFLWEEDKAYELIVENKAEVTEEQFRAIWDDIKA